jgi:predicted acyl esterase
MGGYQQLVRHETFRGRFRNSFEKPEPFAPGQSTDVTVPLQDVLHTFKKGHRIMIQVHSTWFPYIDRNPQKYVPNIYKAAEEDFIKSTISVSGASVVEAGGNLKRQNVF